MTAAQKIDRVNTPNMKRKRAYLYSDEGERQDDNEDGRCKKRTIQLDTFKKWQRDFDKEIKSITWLDCVTSGKKEVVALRCTVCYRFKERIQSSRNFSDKWIVGADSLRTSNIRDHAKTNQHYLAMKLLEKELAIAKGDGLSTYLCSNCSCNRKDTCS